MTLPDDIDWPALRATAERLLADRRRSDPEAVAKGTMSADAAGARDRVARSLVALWRAVESREDIPSLPACAAEIRDDLARATAAGERLAATRPHDTDLAAHAARIAALDRWHRPWRNGGDMPLIAFLHSCNQQARLHRAGQQRTAA